MEIWSVRRAAGVLEFPGWLAGWLACWLAVADYQTGCSWLAVAQAAAGWHGWLVGSLAGCGWQVQAVAGWHWLLVGWLAVAGRMQLTGTGGCQAGLADWLAVWLGGGCWQAAVG